MRPIAAAIVKLTPSNQESLQCIVPASITARLRSRCRNGDASDSNYRRLKEEWPACSKSCRHAAASDSNFRRRKTERPACSKSCRYDAASDSNFLSLKEERPACSFVVVAGMNGPPAL